MDLITVLCYLFILAVSFLTIYLSYTLYKRYGFRYLSIYLFYLILYDVYSFIVFIIPDFITPLTSGILVDRVDVVYSLNIFLSFPLCVAYLYLFVQLVFALIDKKLSFAFTVWYFVFAVGLFLLLGISHEVYSNTGDKETYLLVYRILIRSWGAVLRYSALIIVFFKASYLDDKRKGRGIKVFCLLNAAGLVVYHIVRSLPFNLFLYYAMPVAFTLINIPPLLFMRAHLKKIYADQLIDKLTSHDLESIFSKYQISMREQEIIFMMLKGKNNDEIAEELYISVKTVKSHIYNIYKKVGVHNRVKFLNFIQEAVRKS